MLVLLDIVFHGTTKRFKLHMQRLRWYWSCTCLDASILDKRSILLELGGYHLECITAAQRWSQIEKVRISIRIILIDIVQFFPCCLDCIAHILANTIFMLRCWKLPLVETLILEITLLIGMMVLQTGLIVQHLSALSGQEIRSVCRFSLPRVEICLIGLLAGHAWLRWQVCDRFQTAICLDAHCQASGFGGRGTCLRPEKFPVSALHASFCIDK